VDAEDTSALLAEAFRLLQLGAIERGVVRPLACPIGTRVERLATVVVAVAPVVFEEVAILVGFPRMVRLRAIRNKVFS